MATSYAQLFALTTLIEQPSLLNTYEITIDSVWTSLGLTPLLHASTLLPDPLYEKPAYA